MTTEYKPAPLYSTQTHDAFIRLSDNAIVYRPVAKRSKS